MNLANAVRNYVRSKLKIVARLLNSASNGRLTPNAVTMIGFLMHIPIAWLIATGSHNILAAILLIIFGLFDVLDGELARLQHKTSPGGMLLDATTDRMKEALLYAGAAYALAMSATPTNAAWAAAACGASICVSYVKAKGEAAIASTKNFEHSKLNRVFKDGLLTFEFRMTVLVAGLLFNKLVFAVAIITVLATITAMQRLFLISRSLANVKN